MLTELDRAVLTQDLPAYGLTEGDIGTVVSVYPAGEAYEVEFMTLDGEALAVVTALAGQVRPIAPNEIAHARAIPT